MRREPSVPEDLSGLYPTNHIQVVVTSFGYGHGDPPLADITLDTRRLLRNPHDDPGMRHRTGLDPAVRDHVRTTPGTARLVEHATGMACDLLEDVANSRFLLVRVAVGCVGGRHRSVAVVEGIVAALRAEGVGADVEHRDIAKPAIQE